MKTETLVDTESYVRKRCDKCKQCLWSAKDDVRCHRSVEVVRGLNKPWTRYCGGTLRVVKRVKKPRAKVTDLPSVAESKRKDAAKQQARAEARARALRTRIRRLETALKKQERRVSHYARLATRSDAEIAAARERIKTAQLVQTVTRRLLKAAGVEVTR